MLLQSASRHLQFLSGCHPCKLHLKLANQRMEPQKVPAIWKEMKFAQDAPGQYKGPQLRHSLSHDLSDFRCQFLAGERLGDEVHTCIQYAAIDHSVARKACNDQDLQSRLAPYGLSRHFMLVHDGRADINKHQLDFGARIKWT